MMKLLVIRNLKGLVAVLLMCVVGQVGATTSINAFNVETSLPDIVSNNLNLSYTASSGDFNIFTSPPDAIGIYTDSANNPNPFLGVFLLDFSVDATGALDSADAQGNFGSFTITDTASFPMIFSPLNGVGASTLLSGFVTDVAFGNGIIEVLLNITSGSGFLASEFGDIAYANIAGTGLTGFSVDNGIDFAVTNNLAADTKKVVPVPEPSILLLFAIAGLSFYHKGKLAG